MDSQITELLSRATVRQLADGEKPSNEPGTVVIESFMTKEEVEKVIRQAVGTNGNQHEIRGEVQPSEEELQIRAELQSRKERMARAKTCGELLDKLLAEHNCEITVGFKAGETIIPANQIVVLPTMVSIVAK